MRVVTIFELERVNHDLAPGGEKMGRVQYFVVAYQDQWVITSGGQNFGPYPSQAQAILEAIHAAHRTGGRAEVLVEGANQQFRTKWTEGHDPYPPPEL